MHMRIAVHALEEFKHASQRMLQWCFYADHLKLRVGQNLLAMAIHIRCQPSVVNKSIITVAASTASCSEYIVSPQSTKSADNVC